MLNESLREIMSKCLIKRNPWDNLTKEEQDEMMDCIRKYHTWCNAWDCVRRSHAMYGIPFEGPTAWLPDRVLINWERLSRKAWGVVK